MKRSRKSSHNCICLMLALCLLCMTITADCVRVRADEYDDAKAQTQQAIDSLSSQKAQAQAAVEDLKNKADAQSSAYSDYSSKLTSINKEIDSINSSIKSVTEQMAELSAELTEIRTLRQQQYEEMQARIMYSYEEGSSSMWVTLLTSGSFAKFLNRVEYYAQIAEYDAKVIREYEQTEQTLEEKTAELEDKQNELDTYQTNLDSKQNELQQLTSDVLTELGETQTAISDKEKSVEAYDEQIATLNQRMAALQEEQARAQAELARQIAEQNGESSEGEAGEEGESSGETEHREYTANPISCTEEEVYLLAATIQAEADNQSYEGKLAVGSVICNRVESSKFAASTITDVITSPKQFASYSSGKVDYILQNGGPNATCLQVAQQCVSGTRNGDWLFFMTPYYADYFGITGYDVIGAHAFFYKWGAN